MLEYNLEKSSLPSPCGVGDHLAGDPSVCENVFRQLSCGNKPRPSQVVGVLHPSLDLLQGLGPKGGRQQLLDCLDNIGAIQLGHVHSKVGAKLSHDLPAGSTW